jgi:hypothetical protein
MTALLRSALLSAVLATTALAQDVVTKEATGEAPAGKDEQKSYDEALKAALRSAVEQVAGVRLTSDTVTVNNQLVRDTVLANTSGYVKKYEVLSKKKDKGVLSVTVKAEVGTAQIDKDVEAARALVRRMGRPSLAILVQEQTLQLPVAGKPAAITSSNNAAEILSNGFKADQWEVLDEAFVNGKLKLAPGASLGTVEAKELGDLTKVKYVLYGNVTLKNQDPGEAFTNPNGDGKSAQAFYPVTGEYDLTLFATDTGRVISKVTGLIKATNESKKLVEGYERTAFHNIQKTKAEIIGGVRSGVLEDFRNRDLNGSDIRMVVSGLSFDAVDDFEKSLAAIKNVTNVESGEYREGKAVFRVSFLGKTRELGSALTANTFKKKKLTVKSALDSSLDLVVEK